MYIYICAIYHSCKLFEVATDYYLWEVASICLDTFSDSCDQIT